MVGDLRKKDTSLYAGIKTGKISALVALSKDNKSVVKKIELLKEQRDCAYDRFKRVLKDAESVFSARSIHTRVDREGIVKDIILTMNYYIDLEDEIYAKKQKLGFPTISRYYSLPENFYGYILLNHLRGTYVSWIKEQV